MAIAHVQSKGTNGKSVAYDSNVTAGNLLVVCIATAGNVTGVSGSLNGAFTKAIDEDDNSGPLIYGDIWYKENCSGGAETVSFTGGFDNFEHMAIFEYSGIATSTSLDKTSSAIDVADETAFSSGSTATTAQADELLIGMVGNDSTKTNTPDAGWTERYEGTANSRALSACERIVSSTGAYAHTGTLSGNSNWVALIATFKAAAGGTTHNRTPSETLGLSDAFTRTSVNNRIHADNLGLSDAFARLIAALRSYSDTTGLSDVYARTSAANRNLTDNQGQSDSFSRLSAANRAYTDNQGLADAYGRISNASRQQSDTIGLSDAFARVSDALRNFTDNLGLTDTVVLTTAGTLVLAVVDTLGLSDAFARTSVANRSYSDTLGESDAYARVASALRNLSESLGSTDAYTRTASALRQFSESLGILDSPDLQLIEFAVLLSAIMLTGLAQRNVDVTGDSQRNIGLTGDARVGS